MNSYVFDVLFADNTVKSWLCCSIY